MWRPRHSHPLLVGIPKWYSRSGKQAGNFLNVKYIPTIWPNHSSPRYLPKRNENVFVQKLVCSFIYKCQEPETQTSFSEWVDKQTMVYAIQWNTAHQEEETNHWHSPDSIWDWSQWKKPDSKDSKVRLHTHCMLPFIRIFQKWKTTKNRSVFLWVRIRGRGWR